MSASNITGRDANSPDAFLVRKQKGPMTAAIQNLRIPLKTNNLTVDIMNKSKKEKKVLPFNRDPEFYFRVGVKYFRKRKNDVSLKYLKKAAEMDPYNAEYKFNLAGVLAETKRIEESNKVLMDIIKNIDPTLAECYFGMGCNYFDLGDFEKSRESFERYVWADPNGELIDEAQDILYYLKMYENVGSNDKLAKKISKMARQGEKYLSEGAFEKAGEILERIIELNPRLTSPRNNLSLVYFYLGDIKKAISLAKSVLKIDSDNLHATCNLLLFFKSGGNAGEYRGHLRKLSSRIPESKEDFSKMLDTFIKVKEHFYICRLVLIRLRESKESALFHILATALFNMKEFEYAKEVCECVAEVFPGCEAVGRSFIKIIEETEQGLTEFKELGYIDGVDK